MSSILGLDIGGANLKAAHSNGNAISIPFALWKEPARLPQALRDLLLRTEPAEMLAVTMTGELCDCFEYKRQGVQAILDAVAEVAADKPVRIWSNEGRFLDMAAARAAPLQAASANWLALATFAGRYARKGTALLVDVGSTTTDIVPLLGGRPKPRGRTDLQRLNVGELMYKGVRRTPLCALLDGFFSAEVFATTQDLYLHMGLLAEDADDCDTADGRPATKAAAEARLARMLCADLETSTAKQRNSFCRFAYDNQIILLGESIIVAARGLPTLPQTVIFSGEGEFLIRLALKAQRELPPCRVVSLANELTPAVSRAACAYAVAVLAAEA